MQALHWSYEFGRRAHCECEARHGGTLARLSTTFESDRDVLALQIYTLCQAALF
jgi:hypothetical protein